MNVSPPVMKKRLVTYVKWAIEWLADAANGKLLQPGEPYELPDFSRKLLGDSLPEGVTLLFSETKETYDKWKSYIGKNGKVECFYGKDINGLFACRFFDDKDNVIYETKFNKINLRDRKYLATWILLPDIRYKRHRPVQTYKEITELCKNSNMDFYDIFLHAWDIERHPNMGRLLIGFPIPELYNEDTVEIHWQPLIFENFSAQHKKYKKNYSKLWRKLIANGDFSPQKQLPWGKSKNIAYDRLYVRGGHEATFKTKNIAIFGCGAIGSLVAELLVRGGLQTLYLFDYDSVEFGNLCRHTLDGRDFNNFKSKALAKRLASVNPMADIKAYTFDIPEHLVNSKLLENIFSDINLFIDCTTSEAAFQWLDDYAGKHSKDMITMFINFYAEFLTLIISGSKNSCSTIFQDLIYCIKERQSPISYEEYSREPSEEEKILEGAGCWHATFPALNCHINVLVSAAVDIINKHIAHNTGRGLAVIIKRNVLSEKNMIYPYSIIEIKWLKAYE